MLRPILVIQHEDDCPPGWFGEDWARAGAVLDVRTPYRSPDAIRQGLPAEVSGYAALVVLGGEMGANDDADHAWLTTTKDLIRRAVSAGTPTLGVCLGHQLMTVALGGRVHRNPAGQASGITPVRLTPAGADDPLIGELEGRHVLQWNDDVVAELPSGATVLATAPDGSVQAARFASRAWGVQFHPEAGPDIFDQWTVAKPSATARARAAAADVRTAEPRLRALGEVLAHRFLAQLAPGASAVRRVDDLDRHLGALQHPLAH